MAKIKNIRKYVVNAAIVEDNTKTKDEEDYVVKTIGGFGAWQAIVVTVAALSRFIAIWNLLSILFLTSTTEYKCVELKENTTIEAENSTCYNDCEQYEFYQDIFEDTLISEFDLICGKEWLASFTQTILMFGLLIGVSIFGWISDRFGRSVGLILSGVMNVVLMFAAAFSISYWMLTSIRFFIGAASGGIMAITAVYTLEVVGPQYREIAGSLALSPDGIAQASLALFAYYSSTWSQYLLLISIASILIVVILLFLPETPRWLIANGKSDKSILLLTNAAKFNKLSVENIKKDIDKSIEDIRAKINESETSNYTYLDLFRTKKLTITTTASFIVWFVVGVSYYGINQYLTVLTSNVYIVVVILGLIQVPLCPMSMIITKYFPRKLSSIISLLLVGVTMLLLIFVPEDTWISLMFGIIGVVAGSIAFVIIYIHDTELYPTPIRNMGFSLNTAGATLGGMVAPFVANINPHWVSSLIFAILPVIASGFCLLLPETKGKKLRDTLDD